MHHRLSGSRSLVDGHEGVLACGAGDEASHEVLQADGLCAVLAEDFVVDALNHLLTDLLANLQACIVSSLLLVVASICSFVQTLDELVDVGCVDVHAHCQVLLEALSLCDTECIAQCVKVTLKVSFGSAICAATHDCSHCNGCEN